jgi:hypothetical protein
VFEYATHVVRSLASVFGYLTHVSVSFAHVLGYDVGCLLGYDVGIFCTCFSVFCTWFCIRCRVIYLDGERSEPPAGGHKGGGAVGGHHHLRHNHIHGTAVCPCCPPPPPYGHKGFQQLALYLQVVVVGVSRVLLCACCNRACRMRMPYSIKTRRCEDANKVRY